MTKSERILIAGILGMASGFIIGTVLAPWSGEELQKKIGVRKRTVEEKLKRLEHKIDRLAEKLKEES